MGFFFRSLIDTNPPFWRVLCLTLLTSDLVVLSGIWRVDLGLLDVVLLVAGLYVLLRAFQYASAGVNAANVSGRRLYVSGRAMLDPRTEIYAGDFGNALFGFGAKVLAEPDTAEFLISLQGDSGVARCEDRFGYIEHIPLPSGTKLSSVAPVGAFIFRSTFTQRHNRVNRFRLNDPRIKRAVLVCALVAQLGLAGRQFFATEPQQSVALGEYVFAAFGVPVTYMFLRRAHRACRLLLPELAGRTVFISGEPGTAARGRVARLVVSQGALMVDESDCAEIRIELLRGQCRLHVLGAGMASVFVDDEAIIDELKWPLRALYGRRSYAEHRSKTVD